MTLRAELVSHAQATIANGSKSFRFASRLFDRRTRERAWLLYAWCRACDDLADGQSLGGSVIAVGDSARRLRYLTGQTERALAGTSTLDPSFDGLRLLLAERALPRRFVDDHLAGFARDCAGWRPADEDDLLSYCYQVAGAVGCLMAVVMGVSPEDEDTLDRACDLGIAFQLANIVRDLGEDHAAGRCYLPARWLAEAGLGPEDYMEPDNRAKLIVIAGRLCEMMQAYQASARVGAARLPFRSRWAVLSAARIYGAIALEVSRRAGEAWDSRVVVPGRAKLGHVVAAAWEATTSPREVDRSGLWTRPR